MDANLILIAILVIYLFFYLYFVKKLKIYKFVVTQIIIISVSSLAIGYLISEIRFHFAIHLLILLLLFTTGLIIYGIKLVKNFK